MLCLPTRTLLFVVVICTLPGFEACSSAGPNGDFNGDGFWDCVDINALTSAIATMSPDLSFDMNGDGALTYADITAETGWLAVAGANRPPETGGNPFLVGDATLDGTVDGRDFIEWNANKFSNLDHWCGGDFNANGVVDGLDFIAWNENKFTSSDQIGTAPESGAASHSLDCDFDGDGLCDGADIDSLVAEIAAGSLNHSFDMTGDGFVNLDDRDAWLTLAGERHTTSGLGYLIGDANLDTIVGGLDFIEWNLNKFTSLAAWTAETSMPMVLSTDSTISNGTTTGSAAPTTPVPYLSHRTCYSHGWGS